MTEQTPTASSACPICGKDAPHYHSPAEVEQHRETEAWVEESWQQIRPLIFPDAATPTPAPDAVAEGLREFLTLDSGDRTRAWCEWGHNAVPAALPASQPVADVSDTVAFVQEWLMSGDYKPDQWTKDFAAAIDARSAKWEVQHTSTMNDLVQMAMARDEAEAQVTTLTARVETLEGALSDVEKASSLAIARYHARLALSPDPAVKSDEEAMYSRWLAGDETLTLKSGQHLRFQARIDRETLERSAES